MDILLKFIGKIAGTVIGLIFGGLIGGLVGFGIGALIDQFLLQGMPSSPDKKRKPAKVKLKDDSTADFILSALVLAAAVVKADGEVEELEMSYVQNFLVDQFGTDHIHDYMQVLENAIEQDFDLQKVAQQMRLSNSYETRLQIIYFLFQIANADYTIDENEIAVIKVISLHLNVPNSDYLSIKAMFYEEMDAFYSILEVRPSASDSEIKAAYREVSNRYHPDKVAHLGSTLQRVAEEKFKKVQQAYESIKRKRGMK